jgi:phosphatidylglycerol lysyltransferase
MSLWFMHGGEAVVGYVSRSKVRVVAGAPVCLPQHLADVVAAFEADAHSNGEQVCYFGAEQQLLLTLAHRGSGRSGSIPIAHMLLGAQPIWTPHHWESIVSRKASLRAQVSRARNKHVQVTRWHSTDATNHPALVRCLHEWLQTRSLPPMHFLVEPETLACLDDRRVYVAERGGGVVAFLVASPIPLRNGWLVEQIIRGKSAPNGTTELLLDTMMRDVAAHGSRVVTLGLSPLSRRAGIPLSLHPVWLRILLAWVRTHGQRFYNFDGIDAFKAKALPELWEPVYALTSDQHISLRMIYAIAGAFSGGSPIRFLWQGIHRAMKQEVVWLIQRIR